MDESSAPAYQKVTVVPFQLAVKTGGGITGTRAASQGPTTFTPAVFCVVRADDANSATIYWGAGNNASDPLAKGETISFDLPIGFYFDASELCVSGTAPDSIHIVIGVLESIPRV